MAKKPAEKNEIMIVSEELLRSKVYVIRGQQVMLDFDLAEIYGYETKRFNQQVKNNIDKFPEDFRFQLTSEEIRMPSLRSKNLTLNVSGNQRGLHSKYAPYAFTEQGIYMLMTVLRGELATKQSLALIRLFKRMNDYVSVNEPILHTSIKLLAAQTEENTEAIKRIGSNMVTHDDLTDFMKLFDSGIKDEEILIMDGKPFEADVAYQRIYKKAKKYIVVIDDYISTKTLAHLTVTKPGIEITIISDNKGKALRASEYEDFISEYPGMNIKFIRSNGRIHDRYIILDYDKKDLKVYHSGASIKDAGRRITSITEMKDNVLYQQLVKELLGNPDLKL